MLNFLISKFTSSPIKSSLADILNMRSTVPAEAKQTDSRLFIHASEQPVRPTPAPNTTEKSDDYYNVALRINDKWRVIVCPDGIQWILQYRKGTYQGKPAWRAKLFIRSKCGLRNHIRELIGDIPDDANLILELFPDWIKQ